MASSSIQETTGFEIQTRDMGKPHHPLPPPPSSPLKFPPTGSNYYTTSRVPVVENKNYMNLLKYRAKNKLCLFCISLLN